MLKKIIQLHRVTNCFLILYTNLKLSILFINVFLNRRLQAQVLIKKQNAQSKK